MKTFMKIIAGILISWFVWSDVQAQKKKLPKKSSSKTSIAKFTPREFAVPGADFMVNDVNESSMAYPILKTLMQNGVTIAYADSTLRPKDPLRRGDFIVSFNSSLEAIKRAEDSVGLPTSSINAYDKYQTNITSISEIADIEEGSIYYPSAQSLIERWKISAPFTKSKLLNASSIMQEREVYDIIEGTFGYVSQAVNPYAEAMTRGKFAMVLSNALNEKLVQVNYMASVNRDSAANEKRQQQTAMQQQEKVRRDSLIKEVELGKLEAQKKEAEAWNKLSEKEKRKQARMNVKRQQ